MILGVRGDGSHLESGRTRERERLLLGVSLGGPGPIRLRWHLAGVAQAPTASPTQDADTWVLEPSTHGVGALRSAEAAGRVRRQQRPGPQATALP